MQTNLGNYDMGGYHPGAGLPKRLLWYSVNALIFHSWWFPGSSLKCALLRTFGARIGRQVVLKPRINIKYPWHLEIGDHVWLGEGVWIDSLGPVKIGSHVCISQEAYLLTGNHNYKLPTFRLMVEGIEIEDGAWVGARAVICPGVRVGNHAIVTVGSIMTKDAEPNGIYQGNPAQWVRSRTLQGPG